jgi:hypothetical protein
VVSWATAIAGKASIDSRRKDMARRKCMSAIEGDSHQNRVNVPDPSYPCGVIFQHFSRRHDIVR